MARILIVDDDTKLRKRLERLLTDEGHTVQSADTAEMSLEIVRSGTPNPAILDVRLPGMSRIDAFRAIRQDEPGLPVIIRTAHGSDEIADEANGLGAFAVVLKPFDIPFMLRLIEEALKAN